MEQITNAMRMELAPFPGESMSLSDIDRHLVELDGEFRELFAASKEDGGYLKYTNTFKRITEDMIRQLVDTVTVLSADRIRVCLRGGMEIEQTIEGGR